MVSAPVQVQGKKQRAKNYFLETDQVLSCLVYTPWVICVIRWPSTKSWAFVVPLADHFSLSISVTDHSHCLVFKNLMDKSRNKSWKSSTDAKEHYHHFSIWVAVRNQTLLSVKDLHEVVDALVCCMLCSMEALGMASWKDDNRVRTSYCHGLFLLSCLYVCAGRDGGGGYLWYLVLSHYGRWCIARCSKKKIENA